MPNRLINEPGSLIDSAWISIGASYQLWSQNRQPGGEYTLGSLDGLTDSIKTSTGSQLGYFVGY
jgi:hypothetical protein